jgi:uncharacterized protein (TIGR01732 family)
MYSNVNAPLTAGANIAPTPSYVSPTMCMAPTYTAPAYGYGGCHSGGCGFAIIVVLFILLIIIGASFCHREC